MGKQGIEPNMLIIAYVENGKLHTMFDCRFDDKSDIEFTRKLEQLGISFVNDAMGDLVFVTEVLKPIIDDEDSFAFVAGICYTETKLNVKTLKVEDWCSFFYPMGFEVLPKTQLDLILEEWQDI